MYLLKKCVNRNIVYTLNHGYMYSVQDVIFKQNYCNLLAVAHCPLSIGRHLNNDSYKNN